MKTLQTTIQFCALTFALSLSAMEHKPLDPKVQELIDRIDTINVKEISELQKLQRCENRTNRLLANLYIANEMQQPYLVSESDKRKLVLFRLDLSGQLTKLKSDEKNKDVATDKKEKEVSAENDAITEQLNTVVSKMDLTLYALKKGDNYCEPRKKEFQDLLEKVKALQQLGHLNDKTSQIKVSLLKKRAIK